MRPLKEMTQRALRGATNKFTAKYANDVVGIVENYYYKHGVRPSSRMVLYRLTDGGVVTKKDVKKVEALVAYLKLIGEIDVSMMLDAKRTMYWTTMYHDKTEAINAFTKGYKLDLWQNQTSKLLIMCEATGYTDVIATVANEYRCDYLASSGDLSIHYKIQIAKEKYTHILYVGDLDEKGKQIPKTLIQDINEVQSEPFTTLVRLEQDDYLYGSELENADVEVVRDMLREKVITLIDFKQWSDDLRTENQDIDELMALTSDDTGLCNDSI